MRVLIVYASAGSGHQKAAEALYNYLKSARGNLEIELIDVLDKSSALFKFAYIYGYLLMVRYASWLWALSFLATSARGALGAIIDRAHLALSRLCAGSFIGYLSRSNPDFLISTHFLPSQLTAYLKEKQKIKSRLVTVITDFGVHNFWIYRATDLYVVASDFAREKLMQAHTPENRIKVWGIPVHEKFLNVYDRRLLSRKLGIEENKFTALIITGSLGIGPIEEITEALENEAQMLVVCARNRGLFLRLKKKNSPALKIFGFIDNIQELMAASDIIITKPGGLTIAELLAVGLAPIFISAIPGQETQNAAILEKYGIGAYAGSVRRVKELALDYKNNPYKLGLVRENIRKFNKASVNQELLNVICSSGLRDPGRGAV